MYERILFMDFQEKRGVGYCGLACVLCNNYGECPGCKILIEGGHECSSGKCAVQKGIDGCYACPEYDTCAEGMPHGKRNLAFNRYMREFGKQSLIDRLRVNYLNGITYHRPDKLPGDYDRCETGQEIIDLLRNGKPDPYDKCPEYESLHFRLRLVSMDDAEDLFLCYNDPEAQKIFNSDNCTSDFKFSTLEHMKAYMEGWIDAYKNSCFIRYSIIDKNIDKSIGTVEIFGGERGGERTDFGVLRVDVRHEYENEESLAELLKISDSFFFDVNTEMFITKAIPEAAHRINALEKNGYVPAPTGDGGKREHYYMKKSPR
jgi:RimJ/RimL family protein N-acetyltransferase